MKLQSYKRWLAVGASSAMLAVTMSAGQAYAQDNEPSVDDEIITIGTRRTQRSAADTPAPVDVISGVEFTRNAANDVQERVGAGKRLGSQSRGSRTTKTVAATRDKRDLSRQSQIHLCLP